MAKLPHNRSNYLTEDKKIVIGAYPHETNIKKIFHSFDIIVNLVPGDIFYEKDVPENVQLIKFPIQPGGYAERKKCIRLVDELIQSYQNGKKIYIHCVGGHGRAGTIASLIIGKLENLDAKEAIEKTYALRNTRKDKSKNFIPVPETQRQVNFIVSILGLQYKNQAPDRTNKEWTKITSIKDQRILIQNKSN